MSRLITTPAKGKHALRALIVSALLLAGIAQGEAATYHVVVPAPGKAAPYAAIRLQLNSANLPDGLVREPYLGFSFTDVLQITGDHDLDMEVVNWSVYSGGPPQGLSLSRAGLLSGTPQLEGAASVQIMAQYKTKRVIGTYELQVKDISLRLAGSIPEASQKGDYSYDLSDLLAVTGDPAFTADAVVWSLVSGALPEGLSLSATGELSGTTIKYGIFPIEIQARYKDRVASHSFEFSVARTEHSIVATSGTRTWEDGTVAKSCKDYLTPVWPYIYSGATGDGVYRVQPDGVPTFDAYCDMTRQGGGWTLLIASLANSGDITPAAAGFTVMPQSNKYVTAQQAMRLADGANVILISDAITPSYYITSKTSQPIASLRQGRHLMNPASFSGSTDWDLGHMPPGTAMGWSCTAGVWNSYAGYPNVYWSCNVTNGFHMGLGSSTWSYAAGTRSNSLNLWVR